ncbi:DUF6807 family protein [Streptomyces flavovirens]|uniref:DUF6807 family protein n=1 Tax=Streptomyces flavovirens TaxID=52258 RepID=UPI0031EB8855
MVTDYRPHDHRWHKGLRMTASHLSGQNLWGGNTYVHGRGVSRTAGARRFGGARRFRRGVRGRRRGPLHRAADGIRTVAASGPRRRAGSRCATSTRRTAAGH